MCEECSLTHGRLSPGVFPILQALDAHAWARYAAYTHAVRTVVCPRMQGAGAAEPATCAQLLAGAARRMRRDARRPTGLWLWILRDQTMRTLEALREQRREDTPRGGTVADALAAIL